MYEIIALHYSGNVYAAFTVVVKVYRQQVKSSGAKPWVKR